MAVSFRSPKKCPCTIVQDDSWEHILSYCTPADLGSVACSSTFLKKISDKSESWYYLCQVLWKDKQFHPLERWVRLQPLTDGSVRKNIMDSMNEENLILQVIDKKLADHEKEKESILQEMHTYQNGNGSLDKSTGSKKSAELLMMLEGRISSCVVYRQVCLEKIGALQKQLDSTKQSSTSETRMACPISRAVRAEWIRSTECEYYSSLDTKDVAEAKLAALSASSPSGHHHQLVDALLNQISMLQTRADNLKGQIVRNMNRRVNLSVELANAAASGTLLSWKESYRASIVDSRRVTITPEELREMGELATYLKGIPGIGTLRFVRGGHCVVDNNSFQQGMGWFQIVGNEFQLPQLVCAGSVGRVESDWGWEFSCYKGINKIASFDRTRGWGHHEGCLSHAKDGARYDDPVPLFGSLLETSGHPLGLYSLDVAL